MIVTAKLKAKLAVAPALLLLCANFNVFADQAPDVKLAFNPAIYSFQYVASAPVPLIKNNEKLVHDIAALSHNLKALATAKSYFDLTYGYIKNYGRSFVESLNVTTLKQQLHINSLAPIRSLTIAQQTLPLHHFVLLETSTSDEQIFKYTIPENVLSSVCLNDKSCHVAVTDITGKKHSHIYTPNTTKTPPTIQAVGFYGLPCVPSCTALNSKSLSTLAELLSIKVVDVSNQQLTFNEQILCESGVLNNCQNGIANRDKNNTVEWQVMENQLVVQLQEISKVTRFYQAEVLIAWVNPMMSETRTVTTVFARHKNKQRLIEVLANKVAVIAKVVIAG
ncbi:hypothetical protein ND16A_0393 [Thalassotalea sp. ND16A]|nr:hypothetical protein ND16A_0393 [Thalassotalea sp. ND16A]